jgi:hypothetical protein
MKKCDGLNGSNWTACTQKHPDQQKLVIKQQNNKLPEAKSGRSMPGSVPTPTNMKKNGVPKSVIGGQKSNPVAVSPKKKETAEYARSLLEQHRNRAISRRLFAGSELVSKFTRQFS